MCSSTIKFTLKAQNFITIKIFDSKNNLINEIINGVLDMGYYNIVWNGKSKKGVDVEKGIYYYEMDNNNAVKTVGPIFVQ